MVHWFRGMFEDPQNEMPYADKEDPGDSPYRYPWGGPYDANEQLQDEFSDTVSFEFIQEAVQEVQSDGTLEWAPGPNHPDQIAAREEEHHFDDLEPPYRAPRTPSLDEIQQRLENGVVPSFGDPLEREEREALRRELAELRTLLAQDPPSHGGIGHNQPPEHLALTVELKIEATAAIDLMDAELMKDAPDLGVFTKAIQILKKIAVGAVALTVGGFMAAAGTDLYAKVTDGTVQAKIINVTNKALDWLNTVTLPF